MSRWELRLWGRKGKWGNIFLIIDPITCRRTQRRRYRTWEEGPVQHQALVFLLYSTSHTVVYFSLPSPSVATFPCRQPQLSCFISVLSFILPSKMTLPHKSDQTGNAFQDIRATGLGFKICVFCIKTVILPQLKGFSLCKMNFRIVCSI